MVMMIAIPAEEDPDPDLHRIHRTPQAEVGAIQGLDQRPPKTKKKRTVEEVEKSGRDQDHLLTEREAFPGPGQHLQIGDHKEVRVLFQEGPEVTAVEGIAVEVVDTEAIEEGDLAATTIIVEVEVIAVIADMATVGGEIINKIRK